MADQKPQQSQDPWEQEAANFQKQSGGAAPAAAAPDDDWKIWQQNDESQDPKGLQQWLHPTIPFLAHQGEQALEGVGEGVLNTTAGVSKLIHKIPYIGEKLAPQSGIDALERVATPDNPVQSIGRGGEQAAEFLMPGPGEAKLAAKSGKLAAAGRIGYQALKGGAINGLQGGDPYTGAEAGAAGGIIGEAGRAMAPHLAESALSIRGKEKLYGKTPGRAILDETKGLTPGGVSDSAQGKTDELLGDLRTKAKAAGAGGATANLQPALDHVDSELHAASGQNQNAKEYTGSLNKLKNRMTTEFDTGAAIPPQVPPDRAIDLKRGINKTIKAWRPEEQSALTGTTKNVYGMYDRAIDDVVPGAKDLNQRISSLVPVINRGEMAEHAPGILENSLAKFRTPTGALVGSIAGFGEGYRRGGIPGAVAGAALGSILPSALASPTSQLLAARGFNALPKITPALTGAALQLDRKKDEKKD
jgi:hypothetical protein